MKMHDVFKKFKAWFESIGFAEMREQDKDKLWHGFSVGYCHKDHKSILAVLQKLIEIYGDHSGKVWTTSSKRRALDNARAAVNKALGETSELPPAMA